MPLAGVKISFGGGSTIAGTPYLAGPGRNWAVPIVLVLEGLHAGGGALSDLMCHSVEANRYLLTPPGEKDFLASG